MHGATKGMIFRRFLLLFGGLVVVAALLFVAGSGRVFREVREGGAQAGTGDVLLVDEPVSISQVLPLALDRGALQSDTKAVRDDEPINRLQIENAVFRVPLGRNELRADAGRKAKLPFLLAQLSTLNVASISVRRSRLDFVAEDGSTFTLSDLSADVKAPRRGNYQAVGTASFRGQKVKFEASWNVTSHNGSYGARSVPLKLVVRAAELDAVVDGIATLGEDPKFSGSADFRARRLRALSRWFGLGVPQASDLRDASIVGTLEWHDATLVFRNASVTVDGNRGEGAISLATRGARPSIQGTLGFQHFDIRPHLAALWAQPQQMPSDGGAARDPHRDALEGSIAGAFDVDLRLSATKVFVPGLETGRGALAIRLKQGRLVADLAELEVEGGNAAGQVSLDVSGAKPRAMVKGKAAGIDPGRSFVGWLKRNPLLGRGTITIDGIGHGHTLNEIMASFAGKGTFQLIEGGRLGLDLKALAYAAQNTQRVSWHAAGKGGTPLDQLDARFAVSNGALTLESAQGRTGATTLATSGKIDLAGKLLDLQVVFGQAGAVAGSGHLSEKDVLILRGDWVDPAISVMGRPFTMTAPVQGAVTIHRATGSSGER